MLRLVSKRFYAVTSRRLAEPAASAAAASASLILNFCTPHAPVYTKKEVNMVMLPGESGEYGVTAGHSPIISQLQPGVVTIIHLNGEAEKFFVPGGFALTHANSVTDLSVPEAHTLSSFDEASVKAHYTEALAKVNSDDAVAKATAQIEVSVYQSLARALGVTL